MDRKYDHCLEKRKNFWIGKHIFLGKIYVHRPLMLGILIVYNKNIRQGIIQNVEAGWHHSNFCVSCIVFTDGNINRIVEEMLISGLSYIHIYSGKWI